MWTREISPTAAACTASSAKSAPVGTKIRPPCARASSTRSKLSRSAPQLSEMTVRPCSSAGSANSRNTAAGAHSTTISASSHSRSSGTTGTLRPNPSIARAAFAWSRADTAASAIPSIPRSRCRATTVLIAPNPAMATRVVMEALLPRGRLTRPKPQYDFGCPSTRSAMLDRMSWAITGAIRAIWASRKYRSTWNSLA